MGSEKRSRTCRFKQKRSICMFKIKTSRQLVLQLAPCRQRNRVSRAQLIKSAFVLQAGKRGVDNGKVRIHVCISAKQRQLMPPRKRNHITRYVLLEFVEIGVGDILIT